VPFAVIVRVTESYTQSRLRGRRKATGNSLTVLHLYAQRFVFFLTVIHLYAQRRGEFYV
jgi:hypothetical protein